MSVLDEMKATLNGCNEDEHYAKEYNRRILKRLFHSIKGNYKFINRCNKDRAFFKCLGCGRIINRSIYFMIKHGCSVVPCSYCFKKVRLSKMSLGELNVSRYLNLHDIPYIYGYISDKMRYKNGLHFDFWIPSERMAIEYDGKQHFKPINYFGGKKAFKYEKKRDHLKNRYCKKHHIKLIRIAYNQSIKKVLDAKLNRQLSLF